MSLIWLSFVFTGMLSLIITSNASMIVPLMVESVEDTIVISFHLLVMMVFWLGFMKIAESAGLVASLTYMLRGPLKWLFPEVTPENPAYGYLASNITFNLLGLGNAATPLGLKAMQLLHTFNGNNARPSKSMLTLIVLNTSSLALYPTSIIALRTAAHSSMPSRIILAVILTSAITTIVAVAFVKIYTNSHCGDR